MPRAHKSDAEPAEFATTHWSMVLSAGRDSSVAARRALAALCEMYWYPLYAFIRRRGYQDHDARDLVQEFFAELLEREAVRIADPARGRFRSFLLATCKHFLANRRRHATAQKRGGSRAILSLDFVAAERRYRLEPANDVTPESLFERRWAITLLDQSLTTLREQYVSSGKQLLFDELKPYLGAGEPKASYDEIAERLQMSPAAVKVAVHRLRQRCRETLRQQIAQTVSDPDLIDDELRDLFAAVQT
jgi:RNA polymerase sigma factor (sigma-70 family)